MEQYPSVDITFYLLRGTPNDEYSIFIDWVLKIFILPSVLFYFIFNLGYRKNTDLKKYFFILYYLNVIYFILKLSLAIVYLDCRQSGFALVIHHAQ